MHTKSANTHSVPISKSPTDRKNARKIYRRRFYYSFLTIILLICLAQVARSAYLNIAKYITLNQKLNKLQHLNSEAQEKNAELKKEIHSYTSSKGIEALARDNLKMAEKNEILVVIKETEKNQ